MVIMRFMSPPTGTAPLTVWFGSYFEEQTSEIVWDFGDGTQGQGHDANHTYDTPGAYTVKVTGYRDGTVIGLVEKPDVVRVFRELNPTEVALVAGNNEFGFDLFRALAAPSGDNVFVSPLSVAVALAMVSNGAAGSTKDAIRTTLRIDAIPEPDANDAYAYLLQYVPAVDGAVDFRIANSIWTASGFNPFPSFIDSCREHFDAEVQSPLDASLINAWVSEKTDGAIDSILDAVPSVWVMALLNALYFNGMWASPFDPAETCDDLFRLADGSEAPCRMMSQSGEFPYFEDTSVQVLELPYGNGNYRMTVLLPKEGHDVDALVYGMNGASWQALTASTHEKDGSVEFPKFSFEYETGLNGVLSALGMTEAFDPLTADLSRIAGLPGDLYIDEVKHKTFIDVTEEGTRASAVTIVGIGITCAPTPFVFRADRPFVIVLWERNSGLILFLGKIVQPVGY